MEAFEQPLGRATMVLRGVLPKRRCYRMLPRVASLSFFFLLSSSLTLHLIFFVSRVLGRLWTPGPPVSASYVPPIHHSFVALYKFLGRADVEEAFSQPAEKGTYWYQVPLSLAWIYSVCSWISMVPNLRPYLIGGQPQRYEYLPTRGTSICFVRAFPCCPELFSLEGFVPCHLLWRLRVKYLKNVGKEGSLPVSALGLLLSGLLPTTALLCYCFDMLGR